MADSGICITGTVDNLVSIIFEILWQHLDQLNFVVLVGKKFFLSERDNYVFLHVDIWTCLETFASPFLLYWFCWCWFVSIKNYVALPIMLSYILDIAFCNFLEVGTFYLTHSMQQSTSIHHIRIIILTRCKVKFVWLFISNQCFPKWWLIWLVHHHILEQRHGSLVIS